MTTTRIDHTNHAHANTADARRRCRDARKAMARSAAILADREAAPAAPVITFKRVSGELVNVLGDGAVIGDIRKVTHEVERPIPGTTLRYAKGRMVTKYFVSIKGSSRDTFGCDRLTDAQTDAQNRFWVVNRLRREGYIGN